MKNRILIIEDDFYRYFTLRQVLHSALNLRFTIEVAEDQKKMATVASAYKKGQVILHQDVGVLGLIAHFKKKKVNRLNSDIKLLVTRELESQIKSQFRNHLPESESRIETRITTGRVQSIKENPKERVQVGGSASADYSEAA